MPNELAQGAGSVKLKQRYERAQAQNLHRVRADVPTVSPGKRPLRHCGHLFSAFMCVWNIFHLGYSTLLSCFCC
jgi:hypothetical protein